MKIVVTPTAIEMGRYVAEHAAEDLKRAIDERGTASLIVATGASQFQVLSQLTEQPGIDWGRVHGFHLDEYIGIDDQHPASFCRYLRERFVEKVPLASFHFLAGDADPAEAIRKASEAISAVEVDLALVGIGENGHLAFNDPPADFDTTDPYIIVDLDPECRQQQVGEGWYESLEAVPTQAISMSIRQIMKTKTIYCSVPDERKAEAVRDTLIKPISPEIPASILRRHAAATLIVDEAAASKTPSETKRGMEKVS